MRSGRFGGRPPTGGRTRDRNSLTVSFEQGCPLFRARPATGGRTHGRNYHERLQPSRSRTRSITGLKPKCLALAERILNLSQLALYIGVPRRRLYRLILRHRGFPAFKESRRWSADVATVREWLLQGFEEEEGDLAKRDRRRKLVSPKDGDAPAGTLERRR